MFPLALFNPASAIALAVASLGYVSYSLLFNRNKSYPAISSAITNMVDFFDTPDITKGSSDLTDSQIVKYEVSSINDNMKKVLKDSKANIESYGSSIAENKTIAITKIASDHEAYIGTIPSVHEDHSVNHEEIISTGSSLLDVLKSSSDSSSSYHSKHIEAIDFQNTLFSKTNELLQKNLETQSLLVQQGVVQNLHLDNIATVLQDTLTSIAESSSLMPYLIKTLSVGNQSQLIQKNEYSSAHLKLVSDYNTLQEEHNKLLESQSAFHDYQLNGDSSALTHSGRKIIPARASAIKDYELSKTERMSNSLDPMDFYDEDELEFNILQYVINQIKE